MSRRGLRAHIVRRALVSWLFTDSSERPPFSLTPKPRNTHHEKGDGMGKGRLAALTVALAVIGLASMRAASASHQSTHKAFSGGASFKGLVVKTESATRNIGESPAVVDSRSFEIPAGESQLIVVDFSGDTTCVGGCFARVRVGRSLGTSAFAEPNDAGGFTTFADDGTVMASMTKALCVRNATASPLGVSVWVQALVSPGGSFSLQHWVIKIARNAPCEPFVNI